MWRPRRNDKADRYRTGGSSDSRNQQSPRETCFHSIADISSATNSVTPPPRRGRPQGGPRCVNRTMLAAGAAASPAAINTGIER